MFRPTWFSLRRRCENCRWLRMIWLPAVLAAAGCGAKAAAPIASVTEPPPVQLIQPEIRTIVRTVSQPSFIEAYERTSIFPKLTGFIKEWKVDIGDRVKKDQLLAELFIPELKEEWETKKLTVELDKQRVALAEEMVKVASADVQAAKAHLAEAEAILDQYHAQVVRWDSQVKRLAREVENGIVDKQILLETENQLRSSTAARDSAKATIEKARAELLSKQASKTQADVAVSVARADLSVATSEAKRLEALVGYIRLTAPFDGVIVVRNANTMDFVTPSQGDPTSHAQSPHLSPAGAAPVYVVDRTDIVRIFVDIPEQDANFVRIGTKATVVAKAFRDAPIAGTVTRTSWALNIKSRTLRAEIDLPNEAGQILPGMYAIGKVILERPRVRSLPVSALVHNGDKTFYWRYENGAAVQTEVQTGISDGEWIEVTNHHATDSKGEVAWVPFDGSEQVLLGDLSILSEKGKVTVVKPAATANDQKVAKADPPAGK